MGPKNKFNCCGLYLKCVVFNIQCPINLIKKGYLNKNDPEQKHASLKENNFNFLLMTHVFTLNRV